MAVKYADIKNLDDQLLNTERAARVLRVSASTMRQWRTRGIGPAYYKIGRTVRYKVADLREYCVRVVPFNAKEKQVQGSQD